MLKTFRYRLYPTREQETKMNATLDVCRHLYNQALEERKTAWEEREESLSYFAQNATLSARKQEHASLATVHSQVLQDVLVRLDLAMKAFFRRVKAGEKPGYPRFHGRDRYNSFCYPQAPSGCKLNGDRLTLSKIGTVRVMLHRPLEGTPKTCCIRRSSTGRWYATFSCEVQAVPLPETPERVGIDVGLHTFAALSTGEAIPPPNFFRHDEKALAKAQRLHAKEAKGTLARKKRKKVVARVHERIKFRRHDFAHQNARRIVNRFQVIAVEDIHTNRMLHNHCLAKSISDAAWALFLALIASKAAWAGRTFIAVNPAYTSQDCSRCGHRQKMLLDERTYCCPCCNLVLDRDWNAALNILAHGLKALGLQGAGHSPWEAARL